MNRVGRALTPPAVTAVRDGIAFGRRYGLSSSQVDWVVGYRRAFRYGLHFLPDGFRLDGLVVDVGANRGDFTATIRRLEPSSRVIAVEPAPALAAGLAERFAADERVAVEACALSDHSGTAVLHETEVSEFSSLLTVVDGPRVLDDTEVTTRTLDDLVSEPVRLLKIDVQGFELPVLRGADSALAAADAVLIEVTFASPYSGATTFHQIDELLGDHGFLLAGLSEPARYAGRAQWADACYVRRGT